MIGQLYAGTRVPETAYNATWKLAHSPLPRPEARLAAVGRRRDEPIAIHRRGLPLLRPVYLTCCTDVRRRGIRTPKHEIDPIKSLAQGKPPPSSSRERVRDMEARPCRRACIRERGVGEAARIALAIGSVVGDRAEGAVIRPLHQELPHAVSQDEALFDLGVAGLEQEHADLGFESSSRCRSRARSGTRAKA